MNELLLCLREHGILSAEALQDLETRAFRVPGWLAALQGIAAWIAASMMIIAFLMWFSRDFSGIYGTLLLGTALFLFYRKERVFFAQLALAFSIAGQAMLALAFGEDNDNLFYLIGALVAAVMTLPRSTLLHRSLCSLLALGYLSLWVFLFSDHARLVDGLPRLELLGVLFAALSIVLWLSREIWTVHKQAVRFKALAHAATLMSFCVMTLFCILQSLPDYDRKDLGQITTYSCGAAFLFFAVCFWLSRQLPLAQRASLGVAALLLAVAAFSAPWLLVCASVSLVTFYACHRGWFVFSLIAAVLLVGQFYYNLELTLLAKSGVLTMSGGVLLALRLVLKNRGEKTA